MVYLVLNVGGMLDLYEESVLENYPGNSAIQFNKATFKKTLSTDPFFSDKWCLMMNVKDFDDKTVITKVCGYANTDILVSVDKVNDMNMLEAAFNKEFSEIHSDVLLHARRNAFLSESHTQNEVNDYLENHLVLKKISTYNLSKKYVAAFVIARIFKLKDIKAATEHKLSTSEAYGLREIISHYKGNEKRLKSVLDLYGHSALEKEFIDNINVHLPKPVYTTAYNFVLPLLLHDGRKSREIVNVVYEYRKHPNILYDSFMTFFDDYEKIYEEYISGSLSQATKLQWFNLKGPNYKISSEFRLNQWWAILNMYPLKTIYTYREGLNKAKASGSKVVLYSKLWELIQMHLS